MVPQANFQPPLIRALLVDISGTLLVGSSPTPGAVQALAKLRAAHVPFRLCSNTSKESSDAMHTRMRTAGLDVRREELWTSVGAVKAVLKRLGVKRPYMLLSESALEECADDSGMEDDTGAVVPGSPSSSSYDAVVVGLAPTLLDYAHLNTAFRILVGEDRPRDASVSRTYYPDSKSNSSIEEAQAQPRPRPPLIALHKARYLEASDHALSLGPGPFVHALEDATRTSAVVVGKPTRAFFEAVLRDFDCDLNPGRHEGDDAAQNLSNLPHDHAPGQPLRSHAHRWQGIAVIGDDVNGDLGDGAVELGLWRVLVKTGKYRPGDERRMNALPPDQVCASFAEFAEALLERRKMPS
ncbi:HAD-like domain-containing protein, partial [Butyriboletus roseoflavus]